MKLFDQWQADRKLQKVIRGLDFSAGFKDERPSLTVFSDTDPRLISYLGAMKNFDENLAEVSPQPEAVFLGDQRFFPQTMLVETHRSENRQKPPRKTYTASLQEVLTSDVESTIRHLTQLTAFHRNIPPEDQKPLINEALDSWKKNSGPVAETQIDDDWRLWIYINLGNGRHFANPCLSPVEKDEYSADWTTRQTGKLERKIQPKYLSKVVSQAAARNFRLRDIPVANVDPFDLGGEDKVMEIIENQGYQPVGDAETLMYILEKRLEQKSIYRHADQHPDDTTALLGREDLFGRDEIRLSAVVPPALDEEVRQNFQKKFSTGVRQIINLKIQEGIKNQDLVNLSPVSIAYDALALTGQDQLPASDRQQELGWLSSLVAKALIGELRPYQKARPIAERLVVLQELAGDQSTFVHDPNAKIDFSLNETAMKFLLPKEWFEK